MRIVRSIICLAVIFHLGILSAVVPCHAADGREVSVKGDSGEFKIKWEDGAVKIKGGALDKTLIKKAEKGIELRNAAGVLVASAEKGSDGKIALANGSGPQFVVVNDGETYLVNDTAGKLVNRAKIKEDKVNIYDANAVRLFHAKEKSDGYGVKDEKDQQVMKLKGVTSLREASYFALPIDAGLKIALWALETDALK